MREGAIVVLLMAATVVAFAPLAHNGFLNFDDTGYVTKNAHVRSGISLQTLRWALTSFDEANWHPLTWLSHALDCTLFGLNPTYHHATSLLIHLLSTIILFGLLERMTHAAWQSAFVALIFAVHPLHVESVAWVAERKDVLSGFIWLLTMRTYVEYRHSPTRGWLLVTLGCFALGLMAKPMLITLPFALVLVDYWPLERIRMRPMVAIKQEQPGGIGLAASLREKAPFFALSLLSVMVTYVAQYEWGATKAYVGLSLFDRVANALVSYVEYLWKTIYPVGLAIFYPHPGSGLAPWKTGGALLELVLLTIVVWKQRVRSPYLIVGWLWFLGTLVPVSGLVQVGLQRMADRYMYLPIIGLGIMIAWGVPACVRGWRGHRLWLTGGAVVASALMIVLTRAQTARWKDSATVFEHAIAVTADNFVAQNSLGGALADSGHCGDAIPHLREALRIKADYVPAHHNLARCLLEQGDRRGGLEEYEWLLGQAKEDPRLHQAVGQLLADEGRTNEAIGHYLEAIRLDPTRVNAYNDLGMLYDRMGRPAEALAIFQAALRVDPNHAQTHFNCGNLLAQQGKYAEAESHFAHALRVAPGFEAARNALREVQRRRHPQ